MPVDPSTRLVWLVNLLLLTGAGLATWQSARETPGLVARIERKAADLGKLAELERSRAGANDYVRAFEPLSARRPADLSALVAGAAPGISPSVRVLPAVPVGSGWNAYRAEVRFNEVGLDALNRLLDAAARERPPWRLASCNITATDARGGRGQVTLSFEALSKTGLAAGGAGGGAP